MIWCLPETHILLRIPCFTWQPDAPENGFLPSDPGKSKHIVYEFIRLHSALTEKSELLGSFPD